MKIEAGKKYTNNRGNIVGPMELNIRRNQDESEFYNGTYSPDGKSITAKNWRSDGRFCGNSFTGVGEEGGPCDLKEEYTGA